MHITCKTFKCKIGHQLKFWNQHSFVIGTSHNFIFQSLLFSTLADFFYIFRDPSYGLTYILKQSCRNDIGLFSAREPTVCSLNQFFFEHELKGISAIVHSKLHFFPNPQLFLCIFSKNFTVITYLYNNSSGNSILLERETILYCWELIITGDN